MADEGTTAHASGTGREPGRRVLGLIAEPGPAEEVAHKLAGQLPELLARSSDDAPGPDTWQVEVERKLLPLEADGSLPLIEVGREHRREHDWDAVVVLTELPRRAGRRPILADCAPEERVGLVSLAAMGALRVTHRARATLVHLVATYLTPAPGRTGGAAPSRRTLRTAGLSRSRTVDEREARRDPDSEAERTVDANVRLEGAGLHLILPGRRGQLRLLAGMVRMNRPWRLVPSLSPALAGAMAGAAFGVFYSSIWQLADASSTLRLLLVTALAVLAMIAWLILSNGLWERSPDPRLNAFSALYNAATVATVSCGVVVMFLLLFAATFVAACVIIPPPYLAKTLKHPAGLSDLATVAWLAACLGTVAGALGSGLADEEAVREAAYSRRERQRQEWRERREAQAEGEEPGRAHTTPAS
ncbi:hypothetical protein [Streptomyces albus]|uniref:hypothetical protein n=1 Tax=unclassified Streptomyces TaxID=2593676 RepID=UPI0004BD76A0|nr:MULTISPECIES: hypothetical protein [unclassified Streptomyces]